MTSFLIGLLTGLILTVGFEIILFLFKKRKKEKAIEKYQRRGIYNLVLSVTRNDFSGKVEVQYEIGELESTSTKSKIEVINASTNQTRFNRPEERKAFADLITNSWIKSSNVEWIDSKASERNKKIEQVLGR